MLYLEFTKGLGPRGGMVLMQRFWGLRLLEGEDMAEHLNKLWE